MSRALKVHRHREPYRRERDCYVRLKSLELDTVGGLNFPQLLDHSDEFRIIEMTATKCPFLLDFAGAFLDEPPDFTSEAWEMRHQDLREWFEGDYPALLRVLQDLQIHGIHLTDVHTGNIVFR
jgi:hypothetical protein